MKGEMIQQKAIVIHETVAKEAEHGFFQDLILRIVDKMSDWQIFFIVALIVVAAFVLLVTDHKQLARWVHAKIPFLPMPTLSKDEFLSEAPPEDLTEKPKRRTSRRRSGE